MSIDLRCRHDRSVRELAAGMFDAGRGCKSVAKSLGIPAKAVREWQQTYRAVGRDGLPDMGEKHARYDFETKVAAARAVVDDRFASSLRWVSSLPETACAYVGAKGSAATVGGDSPSLPFAGLLPQYLLGCAGKEPQ